MKKLLLMFSLLLVVVGCSSESSSEKSMKDHISDKQSIFVQDYVGVVDDDFVEKVNGLNKGWEKLENKPQILVIIIKSVPDEYSDIEEYANEKANKYGVGDKDHNSGLVYVLATEDREYRMEVGYGLEDIIPDGLSIDLTPDDAIKAYKDGNWQEGLSLMLDEVNGVLNGEIVLEENNGTFNTLMITIMIIIVIIILVAEGSGGSGVFFYTGGSGSSKHNSGSSSFGGGSFGGGGSTGRF